VDEGERIEKKARRRKMKLAEYLRAVALPK